MSGSRSARWPMIPEGLKLPYGHVTHSNRSAALWTASSHCHILAANLHDRTTIF